MTVRASTMIDFFSVLLKRGGINSEEYNKLTSCCYEGADLSDLQDSLEEILSSDYFEKENKQVALDFLIDVNLDLKNFEILKDLSKGL